MEDFGKIFAIDIVIMEKYSCMFGSSFLYKLGVSCLSTPNNLDFNFNIFGLLVILDVIIYRITIKLRIL